MLHYKGYLVIINTDCWLGWETLLTINSVLSWEADSNRLIGRKWAHSASSSIANWEANRFCNQVDFWLGCGPKKITSWDADPNRLLVRKLAYSASRSIAGWDTDLFSNQVNCWLGC